MNNKNYFEVLWFVDEQRNNYKFKDFNSRKQALSFYEKHKNDEGKYDWWVTRRDSDGIVIEDIVY